MVRTLLHGAASVGDVLGNTWTQILGQTEAGWNAYDWIEFYFHRSDNLWSGRIRIDEDTRANVGTVDITANVSAAGGSHPSFRALSGNVLVFATSSLPANTNIYFGSPTATLSNGEITIWGLTEGIVSASSHELTEPEVTDRTSTQFGLISGQRVGEGADAAIDRRIIRVTHTPPAPTADNEDALIIVSSTGDGFLQRQETFHGTDPIATWTNWVPPATFDGYFQNAPSPSAAGRTYYNFGLRVWFTSSSFGGNLRWVPGGEPDSWRGYANTEADATRNNIDAVGDRVYVANLYRARQSVTYTPGVGPTTHRTWENQREDEFQGTATANTTFYEPGEISVVTTGTGADAVSRAYICLVAGEYTSVTIPISAGWLRISPPVRTRMQNNDTPPDFESDIDFVITHRWYDTGFDFDAAEQAAISIEVSIEICAIELNRQFHPDQFTTLTNGVIAETIGPPSGSDPPAGDIPYAISWAGSEANQSRGTDCRVWLGKDSNNNILIAARPSATTPEEARVADIHMWRVD